MPRPRRWSSTPGSSRPPPTPGSRGVRASRRRRRLPARRPTPRPICSGAIKLSAVVTAELDATMTDPGGSERRAPAASALGAGSVLAHFQLQGLLGAGGMGQVYRAVDLALERPVAIKVLPAEVAGERDRRDRLVREARAQARLAHPNVCHIYFVGEQDGLVFFAMELVAGQSLQQRLDRDGR